MKVKKKLVGMVRTVEFRMLTNEEHSAYSDEIAFAIKDYRKDLDLDKKRLIDGMLVKVRSKYFDLAGISIEGLKPEEVTDHIKGMVVVDLFDQMEDVPEKN